MNGKRHEDTNRERANDASRKRSASTNRERSGSTNQERLGNANSGRRAVLRGIAALTGAVVGSGSALGADGDADGSAAEIVTQQVDASLPPGVTLFDLDSDGEFGATVERASAEMRDGSHPEPIHVTSGGRSTVDYAASVAEPPAATTLGDLEALSYDYYVGSDDGGPSGPGETFLVVENDDGRHGTYLTADGAEGADGQWRTFDVLARLRGDAAGTNGWFEYTEVESGYDGQRFDDVIARFGADAQLVRIGVGRGDAVTPTTLDAFYDNLTVGGETTRLPVSVANRVSNVNPL